MKHLSFCVIFSLMMAAGYAQAPVEKALLWKITGKNAVQASYLFGTFHYLCPDDGEIPAKVRQALDSCSVLYEENHPGPAKTVSSELSSGQLTGMLPEGVTLKSYMSAETYNQVSQIFTEKTQAPLLLFSRWEPSITEVALYPALLHCTAIVHLDIEIADLAISKSMPVLGLERADSTEKVFIKQIPFQVQADGLVRKLLHWEESEKQLAKELAEYKDQDIEVMVAGDRPGEHGDYSQFLLDNRNHNWIPVMEKAVAIGPVLFVVGAGHLGGTNGLISLLRQKGFTLTPVMGPL
jgi:uncharacterized protein YbaP (TraB family)